jgi:hypothetical protein
MRARLAGFELEQAFVTGTENNSMQDLFDGAEIISVYTWQQVISDGLLVDMSVEPFGKLAKEAGTKWPIAMTATAFGEFVAVTDASGPLKIGEGLPFPLT